VMTRHAILAGCLLATVAVAGEPKPDKVPTHIWVREDLFAGLLANDMERFARGEEKLADLLAANPKNYEALPWKMSAEMLRAVLAFESGNRAEFDQRYQKAVAGFEGMNKQAPNNVGILAIYGGTISTLSHRLPPDVAAAANRRSVELYLNLEQVQKDSFEKMPVHHRGEVLSGAAQGAARSGQEELARTYLAKIVETLPGTPYVAVARKVLENPELGKTARIACNSCHEPNRLADFTARLNAKAK